MRFLRVVVILFVLSVFLIGGVYVYFTRQYPPQRIIQLATTLLSERSGRTVHIESGSFHLFNGFRLENVAIFQPYPNGQENFLKIDLVELRYRWKSLLHRKIVISKIVIEHPQVNLSQGDILFKSFDQDSSASTSSLNGWALAIETLELHRAEFQMSMGENGGKFSFFLSKFLLDLQKFHFFAPDSVNSLHNLTYQLIAGIDRGAVQMTWFPQNIQFDSLQVNSISVKSIADFLFKSAKLPEETEDKIPLTADLKLRETVIKIKWTDEKTAAVSIPLPPVTGSFSGNFNSTLTDLQAKLNVQIQNWFFARLSATGESVPHLKGKITSDSLSLNIGAVFSDFLETNITGNLLPADMQVQGQISLDSVQVTAEKKNDEWHFKYSLKQNFRELGFRNRRFMISGFDGSFRNSGTWTGNGFQQGNVLVALGIKKIRLFNGGSEKIDLKNWDLSVQANLLQNFVPDSMAIRLDAGDVFGAALTSRFNLKSKNVQSLQEMNFDSLKLSGSVNVRNIALGKIATGYATGSADFLARLESNYESRVFLQTEFKIRDLSVAFDTTEGLELLPDISLELAGNVTASSGFKEVRFKSNSLSLNDLFTGAFEGSFFTKTGETDIYLRKLQINLPLVEDFLPAYLREEMISTLWFGGATITAEMNTWFDEKNRMQSQIIGDLQLKNELFDNPYWYLHLDTLDTYGVFAGDLSGLQLDVEGEISGFQILETTPVFVGTKFFSTIAVEDWRRFSLQSLDVIQPQLNLRVNCAGTADFINNAPFYYLSGTARSDPDSAVQLILNTSFSGDWQAKFALFSRVVNPSVMELHGWFNADSLTISSKNNMALYNLNGRFPFNQIYDPESGYLVSQPTSETAQHRFELFGVYQDFFQRQNRFSRMTMDSLVIKNYKMENIELFMDNPKGTILIPYLSMDLYDGNLVMNALINPNSGAWKDISYQVAGQLSRVNSSILPGVVKMQDEARIGVAFDFLGKGLDAVKEISLSGGMEVTEIDSRSTENLLNSIDPTGKDPGINSVKKMIGLGYKPNVISFRIQHGNLYPSILFAQPWYLPVRIQGGKISISRIPIKFVLNLIKTETGASM